MLDMLSIGCFGNEGAHDEGTQGTGKTQMRS